MITTKKIIDGQYNVYENNKDIGIIQFQNDRPGKLGLQKIYLMEIPKYGIKQRVAMNVEDFKNVEKAAVNILVRFLKEVVEK